MGGASPGQNIIQKGLGATAINRINRINRISGPELTELAEFTELELTELTELTDLTVLTGASAPAQRVRSRPMIRLIINQLNIKFSTSYVIFNKH